MKTQYIGDLLDVSEGAVATLLGWIKNKRHHGKVVFLDIIDSTGEIQAVISLDEVGDKCFDIFKNISPETSVKMQGIICKNPKGKNEVLIKCAEVIGESTIQLSPNPRSHFDVFDPDMTDHLLRNRHLYIRNPKIMAILKFRHILMSHMRDWFNANRFIEIDAPILTAMPLYEDGSAMGIKVHDEDVFLTQCVGYYLEAAAHAFERVYNMGPSFRGEESRSKRHLMEYWHIKAELTFGNIEDIIGIVEDIFRYLTERCHQDSQEIMNVLGTKMCLDGLNIPFPRVSYEDAIIHLKERGMNIEYGKGLGTPEEELLSEMYNGPFWVTGIPRSIEPFPYCVDPRDHRVTMTADLIASNGYGELLGVAEKIYEFQMLKERMQEKGKWEDSRYDWVREVHQMGCVPHIAFGMGVERLIRWLLNIPHVRDATPFPRIFRRRIYP